MNDKRKCCGWHCEKRERCERYDPVNGTAYQLFVHVRPWDECQYFEPNRHGLGDGPDEDMD